MSVKLCAVYRSDLTASSLAQQAPRSVHIPWRRESTRVLYTACWCCVRVYASLVWVRLGLRVQVGCASEKAN